MFRKILLVLVLLLVMGGERPLSAQPPTASITIIKNASPADGTNFTFFSSGVGSFTLDDASPDDFDGIFNSRTLSNIPPGDYTITEIVPTDWDLTQIDCDTESVPAANGITLTVEDGDKITCTFTNEQKPPQGAINLTADALEITQSIQDLNNSVRLVANKRTFVRFHVSSDQDDHNTYAQLTAIKAGSGDTVTLAPINETGLIDVRETPNRDILDDAFLFELPSNFTNGQITLIGELNPDLPWRPRNPSEVTYNDNTIALDGINFEEVPDPNVIVYRINYFDAALQPIVTPQEDVDQMIDWMERALPTENVDYETRTLTIGRLPIPALPVPNFDCGFVNSKLLGRKIWDFIFGVNGIGTRYYGMVTDAGGFMRGCAPIGGWTSSGPTGNGRFAWDTDGSYGDWYGAHELAHNYGRGHANFCGAVGGPAFPYAGGSISPVNNGPNAIYGFDVATQSIYPASQWFDVMTYCNNQWLSDFTYENLMTTFQTTPIRSPQRSDPADRVLLVGTINLDSREIHVERPFLLRAVEPMQTSDPGDYAIVLRAGNGEELVRHPFTPAELDYGPDPTGEQPAEDVLLFGELVLFHENTARLEIRGPGNTLLFARNRSRNKPQVRLTEPNGGQIGTDDTVRVAWEASDADGDDLQFNVQYSPDGGETWQLMAENVTDKSVEIPTGEVPATENGRFRVLASDGLNSGQDDSDGTVSLNNRIPQVQIQRPSRDITVSSGQIVSLAGRAYDQDTGRMTNDQVSWHSSSDGLLGNGLNLSIGDLSVGTHTITFRADDGQGGVAEASVTITVTAPPLLTNSYRLFLPISVSN